MLTPPKLPPVHPVAGFRLAVGASGMKYGNRHDLMLLVADSDCVAAGVFTRSRTPSAPVDRCREVLGTNNSAIRAILVNAGNANAFTGKRGTAAVEACAQSTAAAIGCDADAILLASTGVIGEPMDAQMITRHLDTMSKNLDGDTSRWLEAAHAIHTTDTFPKTASRKITLSGKPVHITGIAKGAGMIAPDMATMLGFIATDAAITPDALDAITRTATDRSFNSISVDGDTSTSDTVLVLASGAAGNETITGTTGDDAKVFASALTEVMAELAKLIVRDGEGASKFITITVTGAEDDAAARRIGLAIANSPLVKTAIAGEDANWGRIVMAVGKSGERADRDSLRIAIGGITVAKDGMRVEDYDEAPVAAHMKGEEIEIGVDVGIGKGSGSATVWSCDLTHDYISINADYRS